MINEENKRHWKVLGGIRVDQKKGSGFYSVVWELQLRNSHCNVKTVDLVKNQKYVSSNNPAKEDMSFIKAQVLA